MSKKIKLKPKTNFQLEVWEETLKRAGKDYEIIVTDGVKTISINEEDAKLLFPKKGGEAKAKSSWGGCLGKTLIGVFIFTAIGLLLQEDPSSSEVVEKKIAKIQELINNKNYSEAKRLVSEIELNTESVFYDEVQGIKSRVDSLESVQKKEDLLADLKMETETISKGIDFSTYRGSTSALQLEVALFSAWYDFIKRGAVSEDKEIQRLSYELERKVKNLQKTEFPALRKEYGKIAKRELWESDVDVSTSGTGSRYINFTSGIFAANANKKQFFENISSMLNMLRFKQARFKWYSGQDDYTYWKIYEGKDSDPIISH